MAYATIDDVTKRYPPILTMIGSGSNDVSSNDVSSIYLADAESYVNAFLGARYALPLATEPLITQLTSDIAIYKMVEDKAPRIPDFMDKRMASVSSMLAMLRDGQMILTASSQQVNSGGNQEAWSSTQSYHPIFSPVLGELEQRVDQEFVCDERDLRSDDF